MKCTFDAFEVEGPPPLQPARAGGISGKRCLNYFLLDCSFVIWRPACACAPVSGRLTVACWLCWEAEVPPTRARSSRFLIGLYTSFLIGLLTNHIKKLFFVNNGGSTVNENTVCRSDIIQNRKTKSSQHHPTDHSKNQSQIVSKSSKKLTKII